MNRIIRIILLMLVVSGACILFNISGFAGFATSWPWTKDIGKEQNAIKLVQQRLNSFEQGVFVSGTEDLIEVKSTIIDQKKFTERFSKHIKYNPLDNDVTPLLNLQVNSDLTVIKDTLKRKIEFATYKRYDSHYPIIPITYLMHEKNGQLAINARFIGDVNEQICNKNGRCLVIFNDLLQKNNAAFISQENAQDWQWIANWNLPSPLQPYRLVGIMDSNEILLSQNDQLYRSIDFGKTWKTIFDLKKEKGYYSIGVEQGEWHYQGGKYAVVSSSISGKYHDDIETRLLFLNLNTLKVESRTDVAGSVGSLGLKSNGDSYFIFKSYPLNRYSIIKLKPNGEYNAILEVGKEYLSELLTGENLLVITKMFNDPEHTLISTDNGLNWSRMKKLTCEHSCVILFDNWHNRLFRFPNKPYIYNGRKGNQNGIYYEEASIQ